MVPQYRVIDPQDKSVTAARRFIEEHGIAPPAVVSVQRGQQAAERFFWSTRGLFGARYAEENYFLFPTLQQLAYQTSAGADKRVS
jgi:hypothetical protein